MLKNLPRFRGVLTFFSRIAITGESVLRSSWFATRKEAEDWLYAMRDNPWAAKLESSDVEEEIVVGSRVERGRRAVKRQPKASRIPYWHLRDTGREVLVAALLEKATITLSCEPEYAQIEGNASTTGDTALDEQTNAWIRAQLESGNEWAWCCAHVRASYAGFAGDDYLGYCSYESESAFRSSETCGYYTDMVREACGQIADQLIAAKVALEGLL